MPNPQPGGMLQSLIVLNNEHAIYLYALMGLKTLYTEYMFVFKKGDPYLSNLL